MDWRKATAIYSTLGAVVLITAPAAAQEDDENDQRLALRVGTGYSDNIASAPANNAESASYALVGVSAELESERGRTRTSLNGDLDYGAYSSDVIEDSPMGRLVGGVTLIAVPSVFEWVTTDDFGSVRVDLLHAASPANRQYRNIFETGPDVMLALGKKTKLNLGGRYEQRDWQESGQLDGTTVSESVGVVRTMSAVQSAGVTATTRRIEYNGASVEPYDITSLYATYEATLTRGKFDVDLGKSELDLAGKITDGPYVDLTWSRTLSGRSNLYVRASQKIDDNADQFFAGDIGLSSGGGNGTLTTDPRTRTEWGAGYELGMRRNRLGVDVAMFEDEQATQVQLDRGGSWVDFHVNHQLGMNWDVGARVGAGRETRRNLGGSSEQQETELTASHRFDRPLTLSIALGRRTWRSDFSPSTDENAVIVALAWNAR